MHAFALEVLRRYAPAEAAIVDLYERTPWHYSLGDHSVTMSKGDFMVFIRGTQKIDVVTQLPTAVHETVHNYAIKMAWYFMRERHLPWRDAIALPIRSGETLLVDLTPTFPAREIADRVPADVREMRFKIYVDSTNPSQTTQKRGVYGLLEEFDAYAIGMRTALDLQGWYEREAAQTAESWVRFISGTESSMPAYGQFKLYILAWLAHARQKYPDVFRKVVANKGFLEAFFRIDDQYAATIHEYRQRRTALLARLRQQGVRVEESEAGIRIGDHGVGLMTVDNARVMRALAPYAALEAELRARR